MTRIISQREQDAISRIESREQERLANRPAYPEEIKLRPQQIPRIPSYYKQKAIRARELNEPYISTVWNRAYKLALSRAPQREINRLLSIGHQTVIRNRQPAEVPDDPIPDEPRPRPPRPRIPREPREPIRRARTLNQFISDYVEQIKHKKELLIAFLKRMYELGYYYDHTKLKWRLKRRPTR